MRRLVILASATAALAAPALADGLVDNVNGYTLDQKGAVQRFTGLLIDRQGKVSRLYAAKDKRPTAALDYKLDAGGKTLLPGLIDAHGHVMDLGLQALSLDLSDTASLAEAQDKLRRWAADHPNLRWITGGGWNQERWNLGRMPTAADLDAAVSDRPVWLMRVDGHAGLANSEALRRAGVTAKSVTPPGGRMEMAGGKPSGLFVDAATELVGTVVPPPLPRELDQAFARAQDMLIARGVTAVADMGTTVTDWNVMRRAGDAGRLSVRIMSYAAGIDAMTAVAGTAPTPWLYDGRLKMGGVKLYADGALGSRGAWLKAPYADAPRERGLPLLADAKLRNLMSRAAMDGFQVAVHAIGDAANAQVLDAVAELNDTYKGDRRWRIEHAQIVDPADLPRFAKGGVIASMQPVHAPSDRLMAEARLGPARLQGAYAWGTMVRNHVPLAFGSDFPVERPDPFAGLAAAISRQDEAGQPAGGWLPAEKLDFFSALAAYTTGAAYAEFAEDRIGSLTPGHFADFVLIDRDPFGADPAAIRATRVIETWIGGKRNVLAKR